MYVYCMLLNYIRILKAMHKSSWGAGGYPRHTASGTATGDLTLSLSQWLVVLEGARRLPRFSVLVSLSSPHGRSGWRAVGSLVRSAYGRLVVGPLSPRGAAISGGTAVGVRATRGHGAPRWWGHWEVPRGGGG